MNSHHERPSWRNKFLAAVVLGYISGGLSGTDAARGSINNVRHGKNMMKRCAWCGNDSLYVSYHDEEWGVPVHDDRRLFEFLVLEGAQAGLSWLTILKKRENYRKAFDDFDVQRIAGYGQQDITRLLQDSGIVRNRLKIDAAIRNARGVLSIREEYGTLDTFLWSYVDGAPVQNAWERMADLPAKTKTSDQMSKDLKKRGFNFVGSTICYALMQAVGMVNDHVTNCFRYKEIARNSRTTGGPLANILSSGLEDCFLGTIG